MWMKNKTKENHTAKQFSPDCFWCGFGEKYEIQLIKNFFQSPLVHCKTQSVDRHCRFSY